MHNNILGHHHQDHEDQIWLFNSLITTSQPNILCVCVCVCVCEREREREREREQP